MEKFLKDDVSIVALAKNMVMTNLDLSFVHVVGKVRYNDFVGSLGCGGPSCRRLAVRGWCGVGVTSTSGRAGSSGAQNLSARGTNTTARFPHAFRASGNDLWGTKDKPKSGVGGRREDQHRRETCPL